MRRHTRAAAKVEFISGSKRDEKEEPMRAVIYCRVSTKDQVQNFSLATLSVISRKLTSQAVRPLFQTQSAHRLPLKLLRCIQRVSIRNKRCSIRSHGLG
jgi:hypothetical protein